MPSRRVCGATPGTGWPFFFLILFTLAGCGHETDQRISFELPKDSSPRKELIVRGVRLDGRIEARFEHGRTTLNGVELIPVPRPKGPVSPFDPYDTTEISDSVLKWLTKAPRVQRRMREGWTERRAIHEYYGKCDSQLVLVTRVYRAAVASGPEFAARMARAAIDPELAVADSVGEFAPKFGMSGADLYFHGYGWNGLMGYTDEKRADPTPRESADRLRKHGAECVNSIRSMLNLNAPILILCTYGTLSTFIGTEALIRFDDLDRLRAAGTADARLSMLPSTHLQPRELAELEEGGYFSPASD